jgi:tetratricopeptide (TPR) repeat protein
LYTRAITSGEIGSGDLSNVFIKRGNVFANKDDYDRAISDFNQVISLDPQYADAYDERGKVWLHKGDYDRAG